MAERAEMPENTSQIPVIHSLMVGARGGARKRVEALEKADIDLTILELVSGSGILTGSESRHPGAPPRSPDQ